MSGTTGAAAVAIFSLSIIHGYVLYESGSIYENKDDWGMGNHCAEATEVKGRFLDSGRLIVAFRVAKAALSFQLSISNPFLRQTLR